MRRRGELHQDRDQLDLTMPSWARLYTLAARSPTIASATPNDRGEQGLRILPRQCRTAVSGICRAGSPSAWWRAPCRKSATCSHRGWRGSIKSSPGRTTWATSGYDHREVDRTKYATPFPGRDPPRRDRACLDPVTRSGNERRDDHLDSLMHSVAERLSASPWRDRNGQRVRPPGSRRALARKDACTSGRERRAVFRRS